jgi:hypothetical protein
VLSRTALLLAALAGSCLPVAAAEGNHAVPVRVQKTDAGWQLLRDGKPYFIKGVGGNGSMKLLAACGGNSVRTWGADDLGKVLDAAHKHGLTVTAGIWLGHERHGFNYNDSDQVARQYEAARKVVLRYRDHPALLMWGLGNEMEGYGKGDNAAIWSAVESLAGMVKKLDPNHPTMTVIAEIGGDKVKNVHRLCPSIDVVGINSYGGLPTLPKRYRAAGGTKPYVVTEFGPAGSWEGKKTSWGAPLELTSTQKAAAYRDGYRQAIAGAKGQCLGSYAFLWGHKQEATATWFGMLLPDGSRLGAVDAMTEAWTGKAPANRCPTITSLKLVSAAEGKPGTRVKAALTASAPDGDKLKVAWVFQREGIGGSGGDAEAVPPTFPDAIVRSDERSAEVRLPKDGGGYRLFVYVRDDHGGAAVANVPLFVKGPVAIAKARRAKLPLIVYDEGGRKGPPYVPSGWMGNTKALKLDEKCTTKPHSGKTCLRVEYTQDVGWGGIAWQNPANDWGDRPGGWDLTGAKSLTFWARGDKGGEKATFLVGLLGRDKKYPDSTRAQVGPIKLTTEWKQYRLDLKDRDLKRIKIGFALTVAGNGAPVVFYLDDVRYE